MMVTMPEKGSTFTSTIIIQMYFLVATLSKDFRCS